MTLMKKRGKPKRGFRVKKNSLEQGEKKNGKRGVQKEKLKKK